MSSWYRTTVRATLVVLLYVLATHRGTRLVIHDQVPLFAWPRDKMLDYFGAYDPSGALVGGRRWGKLGWSIAYILTCPWCASIWVGGGLMLGCLLTGVDIPVPFLTWLAASTVTGFLAEREK